MGSPRCPGHGHVRHRGALGATRLHLPHSCHTSRCCASRHAITYSQNRCDVHGRHVAQLLAACKEPYLRQGSQQRVSMFSYWPDNPGGGGGGGGSSSSSRGSLSSYYQHPTTTATITAWPWDDSLTAAHPLGWDGGSSSRSASRMSFAGPHTRAWSVRGQAPPAPPSPPSPPPLQLRRPTPTPHSSQQASSPLGASSVWKAGSGRQGACAGLGEGWSLGKVRAGGQVEAGQGGMQGTEGRQAGLGRAAPSLLQGPQAFLEANQVAWANWGLTTPRPAPQRTRSLVGFVRAAGDAALAVSVYDLAVHPAFRHQGVGRRLLQLLVRQLTAREVFDIGMSAPLQLTPFLRRVSFEEDREVTRSMSFVVHHTWRQAGLLVRGRADSPACGSMTPTPDDASPCPAAAAPLADALAAVPTPWSDRLQENASLQAVLSVKVQQGVGLVWEGGGGPEGGGGGTVGRQGNPGPERDEAGRDAATMAAAGSHMYEI
ncbi:hypothetical protein V8C86DRAFT_2492636 [Haematococcus lacustris]